MKELFKLHALTLMIILIEQDVLTENSCVEPPIVNHI